MDNAQNQAIKLLGSRFCDLVKVAERGELAHTHFLTPAESAFCLALAGEQGIAKNAFVFGGYTDAERAKLYILPSYLWDQDTPALDAAREYLDVELSDSVKVVKISGSGYRTLSHRDYLGAVLALGLERRSVGDVIVSDQGYAIVFAEPGAASLLLCELDRVGSDKISVEPYSIDRDFSAPRAFEDITDTVASARFDCVVGALARLSREKAQTLIKSGMCQVDYCEETRLDVEIKPPCNVTVRGFGKYNVLRFDGETKRHRLRLVAQKYV